MFDFAFDCAAFFFVLPLDRTELLLNELEYAEQCRNDENLANHTDEHTANRSGTEGAVTVCTYTVGKHHRQKADNHSERCHKDRTQTGAGTCDSGVDHAHAGHTAFECELNDKDSVLGQQTDKHYEYIQKIDALGDVYSVIINRGLYTVDLIDTSVVYDMSTGAISQPANIVKTASKILR